MQLPKRFVATHHPGMSAKGLMVGEMPEEQTSIEQRRSTVKNLRLRMNYLSQARSKHFDQNVKIVRKPVYLLKIWRMP